MQYINIRNVIVPQHHRAIKPWALEQLKRSIQDHGYNIAYPIILDGQNNLVDGRHRLKAANELGIPRVPWIKKPDNISPIRFALQCNADGQLCAPDDVFDLAELCYGLSQEEWTGQQIAQELGWDNGAVTHYKQIREQLHLRAWNFARSSLTKNADIGKEADEELVNQELTIVKWRESHFRALLRPN